MLAWMWGEGNPGALLVRMHTGTATVENKMELSQKIKNGTTLWPSDSASVSEETWNTNSKEYMHPYILCNGIHNSQYLEAAQVTISRWMDKKAMWYIYTMEYYSAIKIR